MKIVKTIALKAPREHVWRFLTEADKLALWFMRGAADLKAGGDYALVTNSYGKEGEKICWGEVLEMKPPEKLVHTFTHKGLEGAATKCTWVLEEAPGGTVLTLTHEGWEKVQNAFGEFSEHDKGWDEFFTRLRRVTN